MSVLRRIFVFSLLTTGLLWPQSDASKGRIVGVVYDPAGAVVPGAKIRAEAPEVGLVRTIESNEEGQYQFVSLPAGNYELSAQSEGFASASITGLVLNVGSTVPVDITLQVEASAITIEVGTELMDTIQPTTSPVVNSQAILNLPINGRRFQDFALLTPTIQVDRSRGQLSFLGQRGINTNVMVDGSDYNQPFFGGIRGGERSNFIITTPQSAVQEFQVVTAGYTAEYGRSSGGVLNAITKAAPMTCTAMRSICCVTRNSARRRRSDKPHSKHSTSSADRSAEH